MPAFSTAGSIARSSGPAFTEWRQVHRRCCRARIRGRQCSGCNGQLPNSRTPAFAKDLDPGIVQWHSHDYRNASQLREGGTLVVGVGNSGADIAMEVARTQPTWISGKESGHIPFRIDSWVARFLLVRLVRFVGHHVLTLSTPIGRKFRPKLMSQATPLVRVKPEDLIAAGIERVPRAVGVRNGKPLLADGRELAVKNVIWCTGYEPGFSWIDLPIFGEDGAPLHERGVVTRVPGMYFVGLHFLYSMSSATLLGVGRDAERIAKAVQCGLAAPDRSLKVGYWEHGARLGKQVGRIANRSGRGARGVGEGDETHGRRKPTASSSARVFCCRAPE